MVKKSFWILLAILTMTEACGQTQNDTLCREGEFVPFRYVEFNLNGGDTNKLYLQGNKPTTDELESVRFVLNYYKVNYRNNEQVIEIDCKTWKDQDLIVNFSRKSRDQEWLRTHGYHN